MKRLAKKLKRTPRKKGADNRYESAIHQWGIRTWLPSYTQDARFDIDRQTRQELLRRARYWEKNSGIVNRLADLFEQYTVGANGLQAIPNSSDENWNKAAAAWWQQWSLFPDLVSLQPFSTLQSLMARAWFIDGEVFIVKTRGETNRPRIQLIEGHRVYTPTDRQSDEGKSVVDGVSIDKNGRPTSYFIRDAFNSDPANSNLAPLETFQTVKADDIVHLFEPCRAGQYRGISFFYSVMNDLHDLEDLQLFEMRAAKAASKLANVVTKVSGELAPAAAIRQKLQVRTTNAADAQVNINASEYYQTALGGETIALKPGEDIKQMKSERPSVTTVDYWNYMLSKVCAGTGIPRLLVFPYSMQGTVTRADLDVANSFFRSRSAHIAATIRQIYVYVMGWAVKNDRALDGAPPDWFNVTIRPPRAVNVDVGRNSNAVINELDAGIWTYEDEYASKGMDWREELERKAKQRAFIHELAKKYSTADYQITADEIASMMKPVDGPGAQQKESDSQPQEAAAA